MHFSFIASAALLLAPLAIASAQAPIYARDARDLSKRDAYLDARAPAWSQQQIQEAQDHIKATTITYNEEAAHLDTMHANGATHAEISEHHNMLAGLAQE